MLSNHLRDERAIAFLKRVGVQPPPLPTSEDPPLLNKTTNKTKQPITYPSGFVGELAQFICETGYKRQPLYSLAASLVTCGTVLGQRVKTESGMRPNIYCLVIGPTATGKEHPRRMIDRCLSVAGCDRLIAGDDISSDVGVVDQLAHQPQLLYLLDEFGKFIKRTQSANSSPYVSGILEILMKLYGLADGTYRGGWTKTNKETQRQIIIQPHVCLYATTTPEQFWPMMNSDLVSNGFLNRFFVFQNDEEQPLEQEVSEVEIPKFIKQRIADLYALPRIPVGADASVPQPITIPIEKSARECLLEAMKKWKENSTDQSNKARDLWKRANDMCRKVCLILSSAGLSNGGISSIGLDHLEWTVRLVDTLCEESSKNAQLYLGSNNHERHMLRLLTKIKDSDGGISNRDLSRCTTDLPVKYRNDLLAQLAETGQITETIVQNNKRSSKGWISVS